MGRAVLLRTGIGLLGEQIYLDALPEARWSVAHRLLLTLLRRPPDAISESVVLQVKAERLPEVETYLPPPLDSDRTRKLVRPAPTGRSAFGIILFSASSSAVVAPIAEIPVLTAIGRPSGDESQSWT